MLCTLPLDFNSSQVVSTAAMVSDYPVTSVHINHSWQLEQRVAASDCDNLPIVYILAPASLLFNVAI